MIDNLVRFMKFVEYTFDNVDLRLEPSTDKVSCLNKSKVIVTRNENDFVEQLTLHPK